MPWFYKLKSILQNSNVYHTYLLITPLEVVLPAPWVVLPWAVFLLRTLISSQPQTPRDGLPAGLQGGLCALCSPTLWPVNLASSASHSRIVTTSRPRGRQPLPGFPSPVLGLVLTLSGISLQSCHCWVLDFGQRLTCLKLESKPSTWCTIFFFWHWSLPTLYCEILVYFLKYIYSVKLAFSQDQLSSEEKGPGIFLPCLFGGRSFVVTSTCPLPPRTPSVRS